MITGDPLIIYYGQMILNFSLWVHNYTARCEIEIKDDKNAPKPDQRQNFSLRFRKLSRDFKALYPVFLCFPFFFLKLLETGVEFHSQFIQVYLSAIKTRQHALIFYTRIGSQKAITHKFLIMFCLRASVTTRSRTEGEIFRREKLFAIFTTNKWTNIRNGTFSFVMVYGLTF